MHEQFKSAHTRAVSSPLPKNIKHLTTGPKGNSEFCFPKTLNVSRGEAEGNKCFVIPPNSKLEKTYEEIVCFTPAGS